MGAKSTIRPLNVVEMPDGSVLWRDVKPHEQRQRDRSLRGKARRKARKGH